MKKLFTFITLAIFTLGSCTSDDVGPQGPPGPPGPPGEDGFGIVFDVQGDFTTDNDHTLFAEFADHTSEEVFETDVVLVYLRTGEDGEADGEPVYVWRLLPQTYYVEGGTVQYTYDYTFFDVNILLDSDVELSSLDAAFTDDQVFRIAILPATFANDTSMDFSNYNEVMSQLNVDERNIPTVQLEN